MSKPVESEILSIKFNLDRQAINEWWPDISFAIDDNTNLFRFETRAISGILEDIYNLNHRFAKRE